MKKVMMFSAKTTSTMMSEATAFEGWIMTKQAFFIRNNGLWSNFITWGILI